MKIVSIFASDSIILKFLFDSWLILLNPTKQSDCDQQMEERKCTRDEVLNLFSTFFRLGSFRILVQPLSFFSSFRFKKYPIIIVLVTHFGIYCRTVR